MLKILHISHCLLSPCYLGVSLFYFYNYLQSICFCCMLISRFISYNINGHSAWHCWLLIRYWVGVWMWCVVSFWWLVFSELHWSLPLHAQLGSINGRCLMLYAWTSILIQMKFLSKDLFIRFHFHVNTVRRRRLEIYSSAHVSGLFWTSNFFFETLMSGILHTPLWIINHFLEWHFVSVLVEWRCLSCRHLVWWGQRKDWLTSCLYVVSGGDSRFASSECPCWYIPGTQFACSQGVKRTRKRKRHSNSTPLSSSLISWNELKRDACPSLSATALQLLSQHQTKWPQRSFRSVAGI